MNLRIHDCVSDYSDLPVLTYAIKNWKSDFIGLRIIITELEHRKTIMGIIRKIISDHPVTFGSPWPSACLRGFGADFVVISEGDLVFPKLTDAINKRLP